ncbi:uncharacterized protein LOC133930266 [Phragmites australis]|uniref:uncharacterized protein LOC133930266 n=1 Tax=Phragmites australis TaxID=29695 RepID=UPI002D787B0D|nr:uncharacterized protein LOC133930266 [Phragmites australis]
MAGSQRPRTRTASTCKRETARDTYAFKIAGYSRHKEASASANKYKDCVVVCLELMSKQTQARACFDFWLPLVNQALGMCEVLRCMEEQKVFSNTDASKNVWGARSLKKKSELEAWPYLRDDFLLFCVQYKS